jgi:ADP-heptose:LPS heptosyltransferase
VANDALGNFAVATPLAQGLRQTHGARVALVSGPRIAELTDGSVFDEFVPALNRSPREVATELAALAPDLVVNIESSLWSQAYSAILCGPDSFVCGPCLAGDGRSELPFPDDDRGALWADTRWIAPDIRVRYPFLQSSFIGEIFYRLAYLEGPLPSYSFPSEDPGEGVPDVILATAASLPEKLWPVEKWIALANGLQNQGLTVGLVGAKPSEQSRYWHGSNDESRLVAEGGVQDLRGQFKLPQVVGALARAKLVVSLDNGIMHFACATSTPVVALFRHGIHRLWTPPAPNLTALTSQEDGLVADIPVQEALAAAEKKLRTEI